MNVCRVVALGLIAAFLQPAVSRAADAAVPLQTLHQAYAGFTLGDGRLANLTYTDTFTPDRDSKAQRIETVHRIGLLFRKDILNVKAQVSWSEGYTGNLFWYSDENGFTVPVFGDSAKLDTDDDLIFSDGIAALPWTVQGTGFFYGKSMTIVRVEPEHAYPIELDIDPRTGAYGRIVIDPKGDRESVMQVLSYGAAAKGTNVITSYRYEDSNGSHAVTAISANGDLPFDTLHPPAKTAQWQFDPAPVPLKFTKHRILIKAKINGVEGLFVLDTGAQNIVVSGAFARRAGLKAVGHGEIGGPSIDEKVDTGVASSIAFGNSVLSNATVYFGTQRLDEEGPDGLIGFDLFGGALVTLDIEGQTIQLADPSTVDPDSLQGIHVRTDLGEGLPNVPMRLEHRVELYALLDTGNPAEILIPWDLPAKEGLRMANGDSCGNLDTLTLGPISFMTPQACLSDAMSGHDALVGYNFFRGFAKVYFDYPAATLIFVAPATPHKADQ